MQTNTTESYSSTAVTSNTTSSSFVLRNIDNNVNTKKEEKNHRSEFLEDWILLQLGDAAFPTGGFAHSNGLEAGVKSNLITNSVSLRRFIIGELYAAASTSIPFIRAVYDTPTDFADIDAFADATLTNHISNRASRTTGQALLASAASVFGETIVVRTRRELIATTVSTEQSVSRHGGGHLAPVFGLVASSCRLSLIRTCRLFLHIVTKGLVTAAVRLGVVGPIEGQKIHYELSCVAEEVITTNAWRTIDNVGQVNPIVDLVRGSHDRLFSRMFNS